ncbi:MAG TPA: aminotransferase class IV, partial [Nitrospiria bacterium]|nr:aminotransferase class IV [Nitrospiria bacterium]
HTREEFKDLLYQVLNKNRLMDAMIRITITRGEGEVGWILPTSSIPTVAILPRPFSGYSPSLYEKGVHIAVIEDQRHTVFGFHPQIKSTSFLNHILVKLQAQEKGAYEGVLLNWKGYATEGATSNLFIVKEGRLLTPSPEAGILEGVTRRAVLELARDHGIPVEEGILSIEALYQADECFLTNTGIEIMPVVMIDQKALGSGLPGPLTIFLLKMFREAIQKLTRG